MRGSVGDASDRTSATTQQAAARPVRRGPIRARSSDRKPGRAQGYNPTRAPAPHRPAYGRPMRISHAIVARAAATVVAALAVAGCGGASEPAAPSGTAPDEAAVETVFRSYHQAVLARNFATACALNTPEASTELVRSVAAQGGQAGTCEEALGTLFATPDIAARYDGVSTSAQVRQVAVTGERAVVQWSFDDKGNVQPVETGLRRVDGQWRLLAVGS